MTHIALGVAAFLLLFSGTVSSVVFFLTFISIDLELSLFALYEIFGILSMMYVFIAAFLSRHKINDIFEGLQQIYRASKSKS